MVFSVRLSRKRAAAASVPIRPLSPNTGNRFNSGMAYFGQYCCQIRLSGLRYGLKVAHLTQSSIVELAGQTATNPGIAWDCLRGQILDSRFQAGDLVQS